MVTALVLINADTDKVHELAEQMVDLDGITEVFSVAGRYDLIAVVRVRENEEVADVVGERMRHLEGIVGTETLIAFRVYSPADLEGPFA